MNLPSVNMPNGEPFLGVNNSVSGKVWFLRETDDRLVLAIAQRFDLSELVARSIVGRGHNLENINSFLEPKLRDLLPEPNSLKDMSRAAIRLAHAIRTGEQVAILGDYDVDGATSSALLYRFFSQLGLIPYIYIPNRITEGYGPNNMAFEKIKESGANIVITVDCGATAYGPLEYAAKLGLEVIIADHHMGETRMPPAFACVNPNRFDEETGLGELAAVGVSFLLAVAINRELRESGWYKSARATEPDILGLLDLVALGTVCDVVPLRGVNRALVSQGLKIMRRRQNYGIAALIDVAGIETTPTAYHAGFQLGPRINAGGRVGNCELGSRLLRTTDKNEAWAIAEKLNQLNGQRKEVEHIVFESVIEKIINRKIDQSPVIVVSGEGWHPGVIGIVASRVSDRYSRPVCLVSIDASTGIGIGSARSVLGVDIGAAILAARQKGMLLNGGGHSMAAGFKLDRDKLAEFERHLCDFVKNNSLEKFLQAKVRFDGVLNADGITLDLAKKFERLAPFGCGNPEPRLAIASARLSFADRVGESHVRCKILSASGRTINAIAFRSIDTPLGQALLQHDGVSLHLGGRLRQNIWKGSTVPQFVIEDAAKVWES